MFYHLFYNKINIIETTVFDYCHELTRNHQPCISRFQPILSEFFRLLPKCRFTGHVTISCNFYY